MRRFFAILLSKLLIKRARSVSAITALADAEINRARSDYVIKCLEAPKALRTSIKDALLADGGPGQLHLLAILVQADALTTEQRQAFVDAYKGVATLVGQGSFDIAQQQIWDLEHIPPRMEP